MWTYAAAAVAAVGAMKLYMKATTGWCRMEGDLSDKTFLITGATQGIGKETAMELAKHGATVHLACRNLDLGRSVMDDIRETTGNKKCKLWKLDLQSLRSVREFAEKYLESGEPIHVLINNAGIGGYPDWRLTEDGFERTMATNHFGPFLLTSLLMDRMKASAPSRIINVASMVHWIPWSFPLDDMNFERDRFYSGYRSYCRSKLANVLFTRELAKRLKGTGVTVYSLHPGSVRTDLFRELPWYSKAWLFPTRPFQKTPLEGAQTTLYVCTASNIEDTSGEYYSDCKPASISKLAKDNELARKLFDYSTKMTNAKW